MAKFIAKRVALGLVTLVLLSMLVFFMANVLPGNVGRRVLGPFASPTAVAQLNHQLGTDQPIIKQYFDQMKGYLQGDMGKSVSTRQPISDVLWPALGHSIKLAILAFIIVVPLSILGGVIAALKEGSTRDRVITVGGLSATAVPDFVWAVLLLIVFSLGLGIFPSTAAWPDGSGVLTQIRYLLLPAFCLVFVLFGYIARMARAGTIEALDADYTRTAVIKGLPQRTVLWRHVLRNSLLPTIAVIATQVGYLMGGLVVIELIFNYQGIGQMIFRAATQKDFPALEAAVLVVGVVFLLSTLAADILYSILNPRVRLGSADPCAPPPPRRPPRSTRSARPSPRSGRRATTPGSPAASACRSWSTRSPSSPARSSSASSSSARSSGSCSCCRTRSPEARSTASRPRAPPTGSAPTASAATSSRA